MKPGIPWSVKGIEPEVREAAKHAARRSGMTLGEWLNTVILDQADDSGDKASVAEPPPPIELPEIARRPAPRQDDTTIRLEDIAAQLTRLARREQESANLRSYAHPAAFHDEQESLNRILGRIESNERQSVEAFTAVNERLSVLGRQIAMAQRQKVIEKPEDVPGFQAIEGAIRNVVDHLQTSESRTREQLKAMQERLGEMSQRAAGADNQNLAQTASAFAGLEARLDQLAARIERNETVAPHAGLPDLVRQELTDLADRIEDVRGSSEVLAREAQSAAVRTAQTELRDIEQRILQLLRDAQTAFSSQAVSGNDLQRLRAEIGSLNQRIDDARVGTASERDVNALRAAVEQLSTRVAQGADLRPLAEMDRRLGEVAQRLDQAQAGSRHIPQLGELERRIAELDHRLAEAVDRQDDRQAFVVLEQQIAAVQERMGRAEHQLGHLDTIERAVQQLFEGLEQSRTLARTVAEEAANRVADRFLAAPPAPPPGPSPELQALEDGLKAVRESAASADHRNQETLEAVHETLEQIVNKLAELETASAGHQLAVKLSQQSIDAATAAPRSSLAMERLPAQSDLEAPPAFDSAAAFPDPIFEPQPTVVTTIPSPEPKIPGLDAAVAAEANPALAAEPVDFSASDDFIAAARRAAQAAAAKPGAIPPQIRPAAKPAGRFKLPLSFTGRKPKQPQPMVNGRPLPEIKPAVSNDNRRRKLLLAGLVLLAAVGAFTFNMVMKSPPPKQSSALEPAPIVSAAKPLATASNTADKSGLPSAEALANPVDLSQADAIVTGALPAAKPETGIASIVAGTGKIADRPVALPDEVGAASLREAALGGDATAQFIVASRYLDGKDVAQDFTQAAYWYEAAASRGLVPAQYRVATLHERGKGVPLDIAKALEWYERAAAGGNVKSMHNAAVIAAGNQVGTPNYDKAFKWFTEAAKRGLADSQFNLAVLYERGLGSRVDKGEAFFWYSVAARQGDQDAAARAEQLGSTLTPDMLSTARQRIAAWVPMPTAEAANVVAIADADWKSPEATAAPEAAAAVEDPVLQAQHLLTRLGFNVGEPDGKMGSRTANAIRLFQLQSGMAVSGEVTPELIAAMQAKAG